MAPHTGQIVESSAAACRHFTWRSEDDTAAFARRLAAQPLISNAYLTLHGDLGAGKTTLARHLLRALGVQGRIKSPSYAVVEPYDAPHPAPGATTATAAMMIWHFDFYRFDDPREWEDAGLRELFAQPGLKLAEWPQKAAALAPPADLAIHIHTIGDDGARQVTLHAHSRIGRSLLQGLVNT